MAEQEYAHGRMDVTSQEKTFDTFLKFVTRAVIIIVIALVFVALINA